MNHDKPLFYDHNKDIASEVVLPFKKSLEISIKSIRSRFFRNLVTVASLVLAVAFLAYTLVGNDIYLNLYLSGKTEFIKKLAQLGFHPDATAKQRWILILSLLVCTVGIINAQLMAVTERFREIGTMKCLGALDGFILRLFILEAAIQGVTGSLIGTILGSLIALFLNFISFGFQITAYLDTYQLLLSLISAIGVGLFLSLIGAFYPALIAAKMKPIEAMRTQE